VKLIEANLTRLISLTERNTNMTLNDLAQLSPDEFTDFVIAHFEQQGYTLEECQHAPAGQLLLFRLDGELYVVYLLPNPPLLGRIWDVTSVEVAFCVKAAETLTAACGYVITRSHFSFGAGIEASGASTDMVLVDGETLAHWIL
jgi:restriction endonuclease Mrr